jgi:parvulin-like peptidyl-prolyl isomerase
MAKRSKQTQPITKKQLSRKEREERQKRMVYAIFGVTAAAVIMVLGYGFYQEYIVKPSSPVAAINGQPISTRDYQAMVQYRRFDLGNQIAVLQAQLSSIDPTVEAQQFLVQYLQQQIQQLQSQQLVLPTQVLEDMIDAELVRQEAAKLGITVTDGEIQEEIERQFGYERNPPTPTPTATPITPTTAITVTPVPTTPPMTEEQFQKNYSEYVLALRNNAGFSETAFRNLFELSLYQQKLQESLAEELPTTDEQVRARHILVETEEEAQGVLERLEAGEDFAALANELSQDPGSEDGDLGWFPRGQMVSEFEEVAFGLQPGETSEPVETTFGYHIIQVLERDPNHALDEATLEQRRASALLDWLAEQKQSDAVERFWSSDNIPPLT